MRKISVGIAALGFTLASVIAFPPPAAADNIQSGDGIGIAQFTEVDENDAWLADLAACPTPAPRAVVLNIGDGQTDDVGHLDDIAQDIRACSSDTKVYGYVDTADFTRSTYQIATDAARWINPYNSERTVGGRFVDGIMLDNYAPLCGPVETPTNNTANDSDYVLAADAAIDNILDQFAFWSYTSPAPLIMANVGEAVRGCHPGWTGLSGHAMPDFYVTATADYGTYSAGWSGGNIITGAFPGTSNYEDGNNYYPGKFVHVVTDADDMAETEVAVDKADSRGASSVFVTDATDITTQPTYFDGQIEYAGLAHLGLRLDFLNDFVPGTYTGTDYIGVVRQERAGNPCDNPGTPGTVERCLYAQQGLEIIYATADAACTGTWGTAGTAVSAHDISSTRVNCMLELVKDETGRDSVGVVCDNGGNYREYTDQDTTNDEADCQSPDGTGDYTVGATNTTILRLEFFNDYDQTEAMLVYARNRVVAGSQAAADGGVANCVVGRWDTAIPLPYRICP